MSAVAAISNVQEHGVDVDENGEITGVCLCGRKLISELGVMRLYCKKNRPPKRSITSLRVFCPQCLGRASGAWLTDEERLSDDDIAFGHTGEAYCLKCGTTVLAHVGGWDRAVRSHCLGCDDPLEKRQVRWCGRKLGNWSGVCSIAWSTPGRLYLALAEIQHDLCGICLSPMGSKSDIQVDHVIPRSVDGPRTLENLRATHTYCNQLKSDYPLVHVRARMGIFPSIVEDRIEGLPEDVAELLRAKHLEGDMPKQPKRKVKLRPVPDYQVPLEGLVL